MSLDVPAPHPAPVRLLEIASPRARAEPIAPKTPTDCLPKALTSLIGREAEVAIIRGLLVDGGVRLLTLTGPGGVGKTRLALRIGEETAAAFPDGVVFVPLATVAAPDLVLPAIASALELPEDATRSPVDVVTAYLRHRRVLLLLDNFEQVRPAAVPLAALLANCPTITALVTSRALLHVGGEQRFAVGPLPLPAAVGNGREDAAFATIRTSPAVQLFVARARAVDPRFALDTANASVVAAICRQLDGLPLAIELAAARMRLLGPAELLARLGSSLPLLSDGPDDAPARLRTMRQAIAWSYDLLTAEEQALFRRLAVFVGGFTLEAAAAITEQSDEGALDRLASLIDKSLLQRLETGDGDTRYALLGVIRDFGRECLVAAGEADAVARRHAAYYLTVAERLAPEALPGDPVARLEAFAADHDNLRAAFDQLRMAGHDEELLRLAAACAPYWYARGHIREGWSRLGDALATGSAQTPARGRALLWAIEFALPMGNRDAAAELGEEAVAVWRTLGDPRGMASALHALAMVVEQRMEWDAAAALFEEELALRRTLGEPLPLGVNLVLLGGVAFGQGDLTRAAALMEEAATLLRAAGNRRWIGLADWYLGLFAASETRNAEAARWYRSSLRTLSEVAEVVCRFKPIVGLAAMAAVSERPETAARLLGAADGLLHERGMQLYPFDRHAHELAERVGRGALGDEGFTAASQAGRNLSRDELLAEADAVVAVAEKLEQVPRAATSAGTNGPALTQREREVLRLLVLARSDKEIADALFISRRTASHHVAAIRTKLGARSRAEAALRAMRDALA